MINENHGFSFLAATGAILAASSVLGVGFGISVVVLKIVTVSWLFQWLLLLSVLAIASGLSAFLLVRGSKWKKFGAALTVPIPCALFFLGAFYVSSNLAFRPRLKTFGPYDSIPFDGPPAEFIPGVLGGMTLKEFESGLSPEQQQWSILANRSRQSGPSASCPICPVAHTLTVLVKSYRVLDCDGWLWATFYNGRLMRARFGLNDASIFTEARNTGLANPLGKPLLRAPYPESASNSDLAIQEKARAFKLRLQEEQPENLRGETVTLQLFEALDDVPCVQWEDNRIAGIEMIDNMHTPRLDVM